MSVRVAEPPPARAGAPLRLTPHPATPPGAALEVQVSAARAAGSLSIEWRLHGNLASLRIPPAEAPRRADGLWRHGCFEAFLGAPGDPAYCELNFAPSGAWAAYRFTGYRAGMSAAALPAPPAAGWRRSDRELALSVALDAGALLPAVRRRSLRLALAAVVEEQSGTISYWALRHPVDRPDFHHPDAFALELPPPRS